MSADKKETFWKEMQLNCDAVQAQPDSKRSRELYDKIERLLSVSCGLTATVDDQMFVRPRRAVPSAGAIYPYEILVAARTEDNNVAILNFCCLSGKLFVRKPGSAAYIGLLQPTFEDRMNRPTEFAIILLNRPWASVRKYGNRGLLYGFLDCAHAVTNICFVASELMDCIPVVDTKFFPASTSDLLNADEYGCLVHSITYFPSENDRPLRINSSEIPKTLNRPVSVEACEFDNLAFYQRKQSFDGFPRDELAILIETNGFYECEFKDDRLRQSGAYLGAWKPTRLDYRNHEFTRRFSAKGFLSNTLSLQDAKRVLRHVNYPVCRFDVPDDSPKIGLRLVLRNAGGMNSIFEKERDSLKLVRSEKSAERADIQRACMNQNVASNAAGFVVLYGISGKDSDDGFVSELKELMFSAGQVGQMLYIGATVENIGVTAIGGFDTELCRKVSSLDDKYDPLYVFLLGHADSFADKQDRAVDTRHYGRALLEQIHAT